MVRIRQSPYDVLEVKRRHVCPPPQFGLIEVIPVVEAITSEQQKVGRSPRPVFEGIAHESADGLRLELPERERIVDPGDVHDLYLQPLTATVFRQALRRFAKLRMHDNHIVCPLLPELRHLGGLRGRRPADGFGIRRNKTPVHGRQFESGLKSRIPRRHLNVLDLSSPGDVVD